MTDAVDHRADSATTSPAKTSLLGRFAAQYGNVATPFEVVTPDGALQRFGKGTPTFRLTIKNRNGMRAVTSLDEGRIADAYLAGDLDLDGDMEKPFTLRGEMKDFHLWTEAWRYIQPLLFGQVKTNKQAISSHYDIDSSFFLAFLDPRKPAYTQGVYERDDETLDVATTRKFDYAFEKLALKPGDHILEVGPGWGAWFEYASPRGIKCTGISISKESIRFLTEKGKKLGYDWELIESDLFEYKPAIKYDAIVIMGVIEHLPDYQRVLDKFVTLLKPGDHILEVGPGWGAWFQYAAARGIKCTGISISKESIRFLTEKGKKLGHDWELVESDLFEYSPGVKYDAIVIMGVIEHLPDYLRVLEKFRPCSSPAAASSSTAAPASRNTSCRPSW